MAYTTVETVRYSTCPDPQCNFFAYVPKAPTPMLDTTALFNGFAAAWVKRPHRIHRLAAGIEYQSPEETLVTCCFEPGSWGSGQISEDDTDFSLRYLRVAGGNKMAFIDGEFSRPFYLEGDIKLSGVVTSEEIQRFPLDLPLSYRACVVIRGFDLHTYPALPLKALNINLCLDGLAVQGKVKCAFGYTPDPEGLKALGHYTAAVKVQFTVIMSAELLQEVEISGNFKLAGRDKPCKGAKNPVGQTPLGFSRFSICSDLPTHLDDGKAIMLRRLAVCVEDSSILTNMDNEGLIVWPTEVSYSHSLVTADVHENQSEYCACYRSLKCGKFSSDPTNI